MSTATVSYVLNDAPDQTISTATQERVRLAAAALGYPPRLRSDSTDASPIVILNVGTDAIGKSLGRLIRTMQEELRRHNRIVVVTSDERDTSRELQRTLAPHAIVDVTQLSSSRDTDVWGMFGGLPAGFSFHSWVQLQHLAAQGHRRIAFAVPAHDSGMFGRARISHAHHIALELGLAPLSIVQVSMDSDPLARTEAVRTLVRESDVTAVAALDDDVALAVLGSMARLGYSAPEDLAVIGFDGGRQDHLDEPTLTTVRIDAAAYGRRAAWLAVDASAEEWTEAPSEIVLHASA